MNSFEQALIRKISANVYNDYGRENYDSLRFGPYVDKSDQSIFAQIKKSIKRRIGFHKSIIINRYYDRLEFKEELAWLWDHLDLAGKNLLVELIAYRLMGFRKIKLSINNKKYYDSLKVAEGLADDNDSIDPRFMHFILHKMNLNDIGFNLRFYYSPVGAVINFILEQYTYKRGNEVCVGVEPGDVVLDVGGCWGDTALYFAHKVGNKGFVYSFEFIPNNIKLHDLNTSLNPHLKDRIKVISNPVSDNTGQVIYFKDSGPSSKIQSSPFIDQTGSTTTVSIDDFVINHHVPKVDFIKMDIEGAEPVALRGAINTIRKFKPKLAITIYHSMSDFVNIPRWIMDLNLGYEIFLGHFTIHAEETVIFARVKNND